MEAVHLDLIRAFGGMPGLRDEHALEAALACPQQHLAYQPEASLLTLAAAYAHGLAANHPFVDGNKRIAFLTMAVFLGLNGVDLTATEAEALTVMLDLASGGLDVGRARETAARQDRSEVARRLARPPVHTRPASVDSDRSPHAAGPDERRPTRAAQGQDTRRGAAP